MKLGKLSAGLALVFGLLSLTTAAQAQEIERQLIAEWTSSSRAPETRTECVDREGGRDHLGNRFRACTEWRTQARIYLQRTYLVLSGPVQPNRDNRRAAEGCMNVAAAAAQSSAGEQVGGDASPVAQAAFSQCVDAAEMSNSDAYTVSILETADWSGWL
ncbi:hypothetical protein [Aurantiacibacter marinus]|uniref:Lysozyme inhibitor LprI N-terminal domain-containing protein n=1 Tax=Aurantiacibacter marinus TaxID=874156 RepID=A0A0H0XNG6_9SPHN|nr:hypothetical protein [Aurantiacibacter marinus]KLI63571.1 hypothetical protein AAV99_07345 [Aurantiacibacter marinus]